MTRHHEGVHLAGEYAPRFMSLFLAQASSVTIAFPPPARQQAHIF
jgi:hypothetical protein